jgi:hypothetical protein
VHNSLVEFFLIKEVNKLSKTEIKSSGEVVITRSFNGGKESNKNIDS